MRAKITKLLFLATFSGLAVIGFSSCKQDTLVKSANSQSVKAEKTTAKKPPNIVLLVGDDIGYTDLSMYGGEVPTPNIEALAKQGTRFTNFHSLPTCSPSRAAMLTGVDNHQAGYGTMAEYLTPNQKGKPGYETYLNDRVVTLPELLKDAGYNTYIAGKWHLGTDPGQLPPDKGFEQSYVLMEGGGGHYNNMGFDPYIPVATYRENGKLVQLPKDFYSTKFFTDKLIQYVDGNRGSGKPFFMFAAYTSPHAPLQISDRQIQKYMGKYDMGWDKLRQQRFNRMKQLGLIPNNLTLPPRWKDVPAWDSLSPEKKRFEAKKMAIYAAMMEDLDQNIGRLIAHLKKIGEYDNTIFILMSDNGAAGQDFANNPKEKPDYDAWFKKIGINNSYQNMGRANSFIELGPAWAQVGATPFLWFKARVSEGGTRIPVIFSYPGAIKSGVKTEAFATGLDFMPTFLDYTGVKHPGNTYNGRSIIPMQGRSLRPILEGKAQQVYGPNDPVGFELFGTGNSALIMGDWKILKLAPPWGDNKWKLFNLRQDPRELNDLSKSNPEMFNKMIGLYEKYEKEKGVVPAGGADVNI